jgi:hypothetical protein
MVLCLEDCTDNMLIYLHIDVALGQVFSEQLGLLLHKWCTLPEAGTVGPIEATVQMDLASLHFFDYKENYRLAHYQQALN